MFDWLSEVSGRFYCQLGEMTGIGATKHLFRIYNKIIVIDDGVALSRNGKFQIQGVAAGNFLIGKKVDLHIITHAHLDHFGAIAREARHHSETKFIVSRQALPAIAFGLHDSLNIMADEAVRAAKLGIRISEPLFTEEDLQSFLNNPNVIVVDLPSWLDVETVLGKSWSGWRFGFYDSGHDNGAMMTYIVDPSDWRYFITGDVCSHSQFFREGVMLSDREFHGDFFDKPERLTMVSEATNGARLMTETQEETLAKFGKKLDEVEARGGHVLAPSFTKNRVSKMVYGCIKLGRVPFVDGSGRAMMRIELGNRVIDELISSGKILFADEKDSKMALTQREALLNGDVGFHPIIAPSGTLEGGYSVSWAKEILPGRNNAVIFPGYLFPDSTSKQVFEMERGHTIVLNSYNRNKHCTVPTPVNVRSEICHFNFTSHDFRSGLVERVQLTKPYSLIIHHCDDEAFETFSTVTHLAMLSNPPRIERAGHLRVIEL